MSLNVAVVGATGAVGGLVVRLLGERKFPLSQLKLFASANSVGKQIDFIGQKLPVQKLEPSSFRGIDLAIASTPDDVAAEFVPWALQEGTIIVDESGFHRMRPDVPLIIPEINAHAMEKHHGLIASPNCSTTQLAMCIKPLHDVAVVRRVVVSTYQATSGAGVAGESDLLDGSKAYLSGSAFACRAFKHPIAFNLIPQIGSPKQDGYTSEEMKMVLETHKILEDDSIRISATCVRVPVANCHSEAIWIETQRPMSPGEAREVLSQAPGVVVQDDLPSGIYPQPQQCSGRDEVFVGRIRRDLSCDLGLTFWCVSDNLRKGAATNAVQIAELVAQQKFASCAT